MSKVFLKGQEHHISGQFPITGEQLVNVMLTDVDLNIVPLHHYIGQPTLLNIYPSIDTSVCFESVMKFQQELKDHTQCHILCISMDTPFALKRAQSEMNCEKINFLSDMRNRDLGAQFGVTLISGKLAGFLARSVILVDEKMNVITSQLVTEISKAPDYEVFLKALEEHQKH